MERLVPIATTKQIIYNVYISICNAKMRKFTYHCQCCDNASCSICPGHRGHIHIFIAECLVRHFILSLRSKTELEKSRHRL